jgi:hypothetical protein
MNVREYYELRNKDNVYGELYGIKDAYRKHVDSLSYKHSSLSYSINKIKRELFQLEEEREQVLKERTFWEDKLQRVETLERINRMILDYDEVLVFPNSDHWHLVS